MKSMTAKRQKVKVVLKVISEWREKSNKRREGVQIKKEQIQEIKREI